MVSIWEDHLSRRQPEDEFRLGDGVNGQTAGAAGGVAVHVRCDPEHRATRRAQRMAGTVGTGCSGAERLEAGDIESGER